MTFLIIKELTVERRVVVFECRITNDALSGAIDSLAVGGRRSKSSLPLDGGGEMGPGMGGGYTTLLQEGSGTQVGGGQGGVS